VNDKIISRISVLLSAAILAASALYHSSALAQISPPPVKYPIAINKGGTGQTSAANAINALLPAQATHNGEFLTTDGSVTSWAAVSGSGTVTTVSVVGANGLAGTVANPTTTPALTLSTSITGLLKGNGTAISAAANTDLPAMSATVGGAVPTPPNDATKYLDGTGNFTVPAGGGGIPAAVAWTPVLNFGGSTTGITYTYQRGSYQILGNVVLFEAMIRLSSKGSATGNAQITGLTHAAPTGSSNPYVAYITAENISFGGSIGQLDAWQTDTQTPLNIRVQTQTGTNAVVDGNFTNTTVLVIHGRINLTLP
jgi:hypothetical protein